MEVEIKKLLFDISEAAFAVKKFTKGKTLQDYENDDMLSSAVERKFEIIGEALNRIRRIDEGILEEIRECRKIIGFRNLVAHGYDAISDKVIWEICDDDLSRLMKDVNLLLSK